MNNYGFWNVGKRTMCDGLNWKRYCKQSHITRQCLQLVEKLLRVRWRLSTSLLAEHALCLPAHAPDFELVWSSTLLALSPLRRRLSSQTVLKRVQVKAAIIVENQKKYFDMKTKGSQDRRTIFSELGCGANMSTEAHQNIDQELSSETYEKVSDIIASKFTIIEYALVSENLPARVEDFLELDGQGSLGIGDLSDSEMDSIVARAPLGQRKVILFLCLWKRGGVCPDIAVSKEIWLPFSILKYLKAWLFRCIRWPWERLRSRQRDVY